MTAILTACGGTGSETSAEASVAQSYSMTLGDPSATAFQARPTFHLAPVFLQEPDSTDRREPMRSASLAPTRVPVNRAFAHLSTRGLTPDVLLRVRDTGFIPEGAQAEGGAADPEAPANVTVYTPAQIRAAYGMFALANASSVTSAQGAQMGAGQTIYIIDAQDDPNIAAELLSFDSHFGLPGCTSTPIATSASLPLTAAPTTGCTFSVVYSDANGAMTASAPSYDPNWAVEIALDVQWAHATAPFARIILIEAPNAGVMDLLAAVQLANQMGPGVVSQSFGALEGSWVTSLDTTYSAANMTYLAATGDAGAAVNWPAASAHVLAVAGTSLTYSGAGPRTEAVWSGTGGGESAYVPTPVYQTLAVPGLQPSSNREVADVTFNADPSTGQYVAVISQDATTHVWQPVAYWDVGGTSLATPQWAGLIAIANALRAQSALAPMGAVQPALYDLGVQAGSYASAFLDVRTGSDGLCATCDAGVGYDLPSGLGSPNVAALLAALSAQTSGIAPIVTSANVSGSTEAALSFSITATAAHPLTYSLTGAPAGMSVEPSTGVVSWSAPVLGSYSVLANARDAQTGLSGQGVLSVTIVNPPPPHVAGGAIAGSTATPLSFVATTTGAATGGNLGYRLSGEPSGMWISAAGTVSWPDPLAGVYPVTVTAVDLVSGLTGQGLYTVTIAPVKGPSVASESVKFYSGGPISFNVTVNATNPLTFSLAGEPAGMTISSTGTITWKTATAGTFGVKVTAYDAKTGLSGTGIITVSITQSGPVIALTPLKGVAGKPLNGSIAFTDSTATVLSISVKGAPYGMSFAVSGKTLVAKWTSPKTGSYSLKVTAVDSKKLIATATIPVTIIAH